MIFYWVLTRCAFGAVPTMEGLLRNGANPSLQGNVVSVNILTEQVLEEENRNALYAKLIFFWKNKHSVDLIQIVYHNKNMDMSSIIKVAHIKNLSAKIKHDREKNRKLIFSLFEMFFLNKSGSLASLLKQVDSSFVHNKEVLNKSAVLLYNKYRKHLRQNNRERKPNFNFEAEKKKIDYFYERNSSVKLVKMSERFFWKIELQDFKALFTNEKHQLRELELNFMGERINISTDAFGLFSKNYELPKVILFENEKGKKVSFKTLKFKVFNGSASYMNRTARKYINYEKKFRGSKFKIKSLLKDGMNFYY